MNETTVSVVMITYGHGEFISQAIKGILEQRTKFDFDLIIANDKSPDNTDDIVKEYIQGHSAGDRIKYFHHKENLGMKGNFSFALRKATGKYVALCEGDDFWSDEYKLQRQIDFLDNNPAFSACFTNAEVLDEKKRKKTNYWNFSENRCYNIHEVICEGGGLFPTASFVFRNKVKDLPDFVFEHRSCDRALSLFVALDGNFFLMNEKTCVYRHHSGGTFSAIRTDRSERIKIMLDNIDLLRKFDDFTRRKYHKTIKMAISQITLKIFSRGRFRLTEKAFYHHFSNLSFRHKLSILKFNIIGS